MASPGLRERKRARTRQLIADAAARLFAERGYENVAVAEVAREAEVAEQTVYNYFPTKEQLVTDRDQQVQERMSELIRSRPPGVTAAAAVRGFVLGFVAGIRAIPPEQWRGELGYLAAISPAVRRLALELIGRQADVIAAAISDSTAVPPEIARLQGISLAGVFEIIISESGRLARQGQDQAQIADELYPVVENLLDELDRWFSVSALRAGRRPPRLGESDLPPLQGGVVEGGDDDELVPGPLGGLAELEVERFTGRGDHGAVGQGHLPGEGPGGAGDDGDPVAAAELDRVRVAVNVHVGEDAQKLLHRRGVRFASVDRFGEAGDVGDHVGVVDSVHRGEVAGVECIVTLLHEREQVRGPAGPGRGRHHDSIS
jgi:AcrR family transcriptional regulator